MHKHNFGQTLNLQKAVVGSNIWSRSSKSIQVFTVSKQCTYAKIVSEYDQEISQSQLMQRMIVKFGGE